ncbi:LPS-assembly protein LptD [Paremcibacter congregatus]|uniref:LPS-assembly protein LptD n=1 Tax=Paremcibacter congregatus TaxID=2043170 RepID=UPI0030EC0F97|tara:strand:- start:607 stop:2799 length:2193 start_codon:yes stop_codon:yes gene_type:complete
MVRKIILTGLLSGAVIIASPLATLSGAGMAYGQTSPLGKDINFSADKALYDSENKRVIVSGNVTLYQGTTVLNADEVTYDETSQEVRAVGKVTIRDDKGNILYMEETVLKDGLKEGFIRNVRLLFSDDAHLAAREGVRTGKRTILKDAAYTPCKTCNEDGKRKPLWQIRADEVTHDEEDKVIRYKNVILEIAGVPILYTPYFSHPDPTVHAASGFLNPEFGTSSELGLNVTIPYYFSLAPHRDLTLEPLLTSKEGLVLGGTYRQHTGNGQFSVSGSIANAIDSDNFLSSESGREIRGHIFSEGKFDLDNLKLIGDQWQWDYAARWVSDDTYLRRYYQDRSDVLKSHAKIENFTGRNYFSTGLYVFQGLDEEDSGGLTGQALPAFDLNIETTPGKWGNQFTLDASGASILRTAGIDTQRVSFKGAWKLPMKTQLGDFYTITASLRGDAYHVSDAALQDQPIYGGADGTYARVLPKLSVDWNLPFIKNSLTSQQIIEPLVSIIVAPNNKNSFDIPNEDSRNFEFDENNLFSHNRYNGYDRWEAGTRVNYGVRYSLYSGDTTIRTTIGQSFRFSSTETFPVGSGYEGKSSDFVGRLDVILGDYLDYVHRFRLDSSSFSLRRNELILSGGSKSIRVSARYLDLDRERTDLTNTELENRKELGLGLKYLVNPKWTLHGSWVQDILKNDTIYYDAGVLYKDECLEFGLSYEKRLTSDRDITPSSIFHFRLVLKNLG